MLESGLDQGAGLRRLMPPTVLRFMPVIQHSQGPLGLQLLWQLCQAYVESGDPVAVLDTSATETLQEPGLLQMLENTMPVQDLVADQPCAIVPARLGWQRLVASDAFDAAAAETLSQYFGAYGVLIVYGTAARLGPAFAHSGVRPLVAVEPQAHDMISAYKAIKRLLQESLLLPTAAVMITERTESAVRQAVKLKQSLQQCVNQHIGCELDSITIQSYAGDEHVNADMRRLALRLLEHAISLGNPMSILPIDQRDNTGLFARSH